MFIKPFIIGIILAYISHNIGVYQKIDLKLTHWRDKMSQAVFDLIKEHDVKFVDLRFTDSKGKEQHVSIPHHQVNEDFFEDGKMFDGSSIQGWKGIDASDMVMMPDASTAVLDPFTEAVTLNIRCDIVEPLQP